MSETTPHGAPAAPQPSSTYASWGDRAIATLWDLVYNLPPLVLMAVAVVPLVIGAVAAGDGEDGLAAAGIVTGSVLLLAGFIWSIWRQVNNYVVRQGRTGQTWGKAKKGIWVLNEFDGAPPGWASCLGRWVLHSIINQALYLDYLWPLWDQKNQTLTDKILSTAVVKRSA
jgi:uncharacterized RDD family membrane protein YckC